MKAIKILFSIFLVLFAISNCFADSPNFQMRLVLDEKEAQTVPHDIFPYTSPKGQKTEIYVAKDIILAVEDVQDVLIELQEDLLKKLPQEYWTIGSDGYKVLHYTQEDRLNLTAEPRIDFTLTEAGKKKLADFTKNNLQKFAAVIGDNRVLAKVKITAPISSGKFQIFSPTDKVNEMAKLVESMGLKLEVKPCKEHLDAESLKAYKQIEEADVVLCFEDWNRFFMVKPNMPLVTDKNGHVQSFLKDVEQALINYKGNKNLAIITMDRKWDLDTSEKKKEIIASIKALLLKSGFNHIVVQQLIRDNSHGPIIKYGAYPPRKILEDSVINTDSILNRK